MPINKKENFVYTFLMVFVMAFGMSAYNTILYDGINLESLKKAWTILPLTYIIAFTVEWFFVGKMAMKLIHKFVKPNDPLPKVILVSALCFVTQMVIIMSFICSLLFSDFDENWIQNWLISMPRNFIMAFPLQVIVAGPLVGFVFRKLFPVGTIIDPIK